MIAREVGKMIFLKEEVRSKPYWIVEWSIDANIISSTDDSFWIIDAQGTSKVVKESDLCTKPPVAVFGEINE